MDDWLSTTRDIQTNVYGRDPATLEGPELAEFIRWNILAAVAELMEALEETRWKPWSTIGKDEAVIPNKAMFASEIVDAEMFMANALVAARIQDSEHDAIYAAKWEKNIERQQRERGYDGFRRGSDKCSSCGRALDDAGESTEAPGHCLVCWPEGGVHVRAE